MKNKTTTPIFTPKLGSVIYLADMSFVHPVGTKSITTSEPMSKEEIDLMCKPKTKKAIVEKEAYEDTFIFFGKEKPMHFIDVYVEELDMHLSVTAHGLAPHFYSKKEAENALEKAERRYTS